MLPVELNGVFSKEGLYMVDILIEAAWECDSEAELVAEDYASSSVIFLRVVGA